MACCPWVTRVHGVPPPTPAEHDFGERHGLPLVVVGGHVVEPDAQVEMPGQACARLLEEFQYVTGLLVSEAGIETEAIPPSLPTCWRRIEELPTVDRLGGKTLHHGAEVVQRELLDGSGIIVPATTPQRADNTAHTSEAEEEAAVRWFRPDLGQREHCQQNHDLAPIDAGLGVVQVGFVESDVQSRQEFVGQRLRHGSMMPPPTACSCRPVRLRGSSASGITVRSWKRNGGTYNRWLRLSWRRETRS